MLTSEELRQIRRITLQAGRRVDSLFAGGYRSAFRGRGMEFEEVRPYVPGDDVRHIDWNVTARAQEPHVKEFREERELTLMIAVDVSGSTRFGAGGRDGRTDKRLQLARLGGALAFAATRNNDRVGLLAFSDHVEQLVPPRKSRGHAWRVIRECFEHHDQYGQTDLAGALEVLGKVLRRRAVIFLLSDFVCETGWERPLGVLASKHRVNALLVHDPLEQQLPKLGLVQLRDAETGRVRLVDPRKLAASVRPEERVRQLQQRGAHASSVSTDEDPFFALEKHLRKVRR